MLKVIQLMDLKVIWKYILYKSDFHLILVKVIQKYVLHKRDFHQTL